FIISDFLGPRFADDLIIANRKHDCATIRVYDPREETIPDVGLICMRDAETGEECWVDTSSKSVRDAYKAYWQQKSLEIVQGGAMTLEELRSKAKLTLVSATSIVEGGAHDVIRKESSDYVK
ncbi:MAG: hypothetical protein II111_00305, partial [Oscillospiraceae bacterium]|nr:hypothetical protein [Oscillospiraceae bacterium]